MAGRSHFAASQFAQQQRFNNILTDDDSDLVTLQPFMDYIDDTTLLVALMESQGVENIEAINQTSPLSGGTAGNNYEGYIYWNNGTDPSKVQIKGSRDSDPIPASYRESLYYSRVTETFADDVATPYSYMAVADLDSGASLFVNEFLVGYTSLQDVYSAVTAGTLDDIGFSDFDITQNTHDVMTLLGHYSASHWQDPWVKTQFYLKGYDWYSTGNMTAGQEAFKTEVREFKAAWGLLEGAALAGEVQLNENLRACVKKILDLWTWDNLQTTLSQEDFRWGLTHGDFHPGQLMIDNDDETTMELLDWEWSGFSNPGVDIATWLCVYPTDYLEANFDSWLESYWMAIVYDGVYIEEYSFEDLKHDVLYYGTSHALIRNTFFAGLTVLGAQWDIVQGIVDGVSAWLDNFGLTADDMAIPVYEVF